MEAPVRSLLRSLDTPRARRIVNATIMSFVAGLAFGDVLLMLVKGKGIVDYLSQADRLMELVRVIVTILGALGGLIGAGWTYSNIRRHESNTKADLQR